MPALNTQEILTRLKALKPTILAQYKATAISLFGSFVRGEQDANSDIDLLVEFTEEADLFDLVGLAQFLEAELQRNVDVVPQNALRKELRESVLQKAITV